MTFYEKLADIFEENVTDETILKDLESYDSLSILSIIAMCDKEYGVTLTAQDFMNISTPKELEELIKSKK